MKLIISGLIFLDFIGNWLLLLLEIVFVILCSGIVFKLMIFICVGIVIGIVFYDLKYYFFDFYVWDKVGLFLEFGKSILSVFENLFEVCVYLWKFVFFLIVLKF